MATYFGLVALFAGLFLLGRYAYERFATELAPPRVSAIVGLVLCGIGALYLI